MKYAGADKEGTMESSKMETPTLGKEFDWLEAAASGYHAETQTQGYVRHLYVRHLYEVIAGLSEEYTDREILCLVNNGLYYANKAMDERIERRQKEMNCGYLVRRHGAEFCRKAIIRLCPVWIRGGCIIVDTLRLLALELKNLLSRRPVRRPVDKEA
jgi:hypothetical protein